MPDNIDDIVDAVIDAETDDANPSKVTIDPNDAGGKTQYGISIRSNPQAWADGKVTEEEARAIYEQRYIVGPGFTRIADHRLLHFLVDWGVTSGPSISVKGVQRLVGVEDDGILGPKTAKAINETDPKRLLNRLIDERILMLARIVNRDHSQSRFIEGWINRVLEFRIEA